MAVATLPPRGFTADAVRSTARLGIPGTFLENDPAHNDIRNAVNEKPSAYELWTVTVNAATSSHDYTLTLDGVTSVVYTSDTTATAAEIASGLAAAWNAEPIARRVALATNPTSNTIAFTGLVKGQSFTITEAEADLSIAHTTTAAEAEAIYFARMLFCQGYSTSSPALPAMFNAKSTYFTAQVATCDYTYNNTSVLGVRVTNLNTGITYTAQVTQGTSKDASTTALAAAINAVLPANTVLAANKGATGYELTLTAEVAGLEFEAELFTSEAATCLPSTTLTTGPSPSTSILRALGGISMWSSMVAALTVDATSAYYEGGRTMAVAVKGSVYVENSQSPSYDDPVYVEMNGSGSNYGKLYNTSSATRLALPKSVCRWERYSSNSADALAVVSLNVGTY